MGSFGWNFNNNAQQMLNQQLKKLGGGMRGQSLDLDRLMGSIRMAFGSGKGIGKRGAAKHFTAEVSGEQGEVPENLSGNENEKESRRLSNTGKGVGAAGTASDSGQSGSGTASRGRGVGGSGGMRNGLPCAGAGGMQEGAAAGLQQAVLWSEILGEPVSKKRRAGRRRQRYGN